MMKRILARICAATTIIVASGSAAHADCALDEVAGTWAVSISEPSNNTGAYCIVDIAVSGTTATVSVDQSQAYCLRTFNTLELVYPDTCMFMINVTEQNNPSLSYEYQWTLNQNNNMGAGGSNSASITMVRID